MDEIKEIFMNDNRDGQPLVSVIIVHYGDEKLTYDCVESVMTSKTSFPLEVIIVNSDPYASLKSIQQTFKDLTLVNLKRNVGYPKAVNIGYNLSTGKLILVLNNDVIIESNCIEELVRNLSLDEKVGVTIPKKQLMDNPQMLDGCGGAFNIFLQGWDVGNFELDKRKYSKAYLVTHPPGAAFLIKREIPEVYGYLLDEDFFMYMDDADLGIRTYITGYTIRYVPEAGVLHKRGASGGLLTVMNHYLFTRNIIYYLYKNFDAPLFVKLMIIHLFRTLLVSGALSILCKSAKYIFAGMIAFITGLKTLNKFKSKRKQNFHLKTKSGFKDSDYLSKFSDELIIPYHEISTVILKNPPLFAFIKVIVKLMNLYVLFSRIPSKSIKKLRLILPYGKHRILQIQ